MKNYYAERHIVDATNLNMNSQMSITNILRIIEGTTFNHAKELGLDHYNMIEKCNAFWIVSKIKLKIINPNICERDKITISTWTHLPGMLRFDRDSAIKIGNKLMVKATSEWCCLDATTRRPRKSNTVYYPEIEMVCNKSNNLKYTNMRVDVDKKDFVYTRQVRSTDIDVNNHTNNLKYNYFALDAFSVDELNKLNISEYEIYFVQESKENDLIDIYKTKKGKYYYIEGKSQNNTIFRVVIKVK